MIMIQDHTKENIEEYSEARPLTNKTLRQKKILYEK